MVNIDSTNLVQNNEREVASLGSPPVRVSHRTGQANWLPVVLGGCRAGDSVGLLPRRTKSSGSQDRLARGVPHHDVSADCRFGAEDRSIPTCQKGFRATAGTSPRPHRGRGLGRRPITSGGREDRRAEYPDEQFAMVDAASKCAWMTLSGPTLFPHSAVPLPVSIPTPPRTGAWGSNSASVCSGAQPRGIAVELLEAP